MILIGLLGIIFVIGLYLSKKYDDSAVGYFISVFSGVILFLALIMIPINRMDHYSNIKKYDAFKETIENSRKEGALTEFERASIQRDIVQWNQDIESVKYYNEYFDIWIPDEITKLEHLK